MKKFTLLLIICLLFVPNIFAQEETINEDKPESFEKPEKKPFRMGNRIFEIGLNAAVDVSNNFLTFNKLFNESIIFDLDELEKGLKINIGANVSPFYFNVRPKHNKWGFGLFTQIDVVGGIDLNGDLLSFKESLKSESDITASVYAIAGVDFFINIKQFKIKFTPTLYYPLIYIQRDEFSYMYQNNQDGTFFNIAYDFRVYGGINFMNLSPFKLIASPGFDISAGLEIPLAKILGITKALPFMDFDIGVDFKSIPIYPSKLKNSMHVKGHIGSDEPLSFDSGFDDFVSFETTDFEEGDPVKAFRPFKMVVWMNWRPIKGKEILTLTPSVGFALSPQFKKLGSVEFGVKVRLDLANMLILTVGIAHEDRIWKNSLDINLNFRAFELNVGANLQSSNFIKSWEGSGVGVKVGVKFGW